MPGFLRDLPNAFLVNALRRPDQLVLVHLDQPFLPASMRVLRRPQAELDRVGQFCSIIPGPGGSVLLYRNQVVKTRLEHAKNLQSNKINRIYLERTFASSKKGDMKRQAR